MTILFDEYAPLRAVPGGRLARLRRRKVGYQRSNKLLEAKTLLAIGPQPTNTPLPTIAGLLRWPGGFSGG